MRSGSSKNGTVWWLRLQKTGCYIIACSGIGRSSPSDFYFFGILKYAVRGERFVSDDEVSEEVAASAEFELIQEAVHRRVSGGQGCLNSWR